MCWISKEKPQLQVEEIKTFKILKIMNGRFYPYFRKNFPPYEVGKTYFSETPIIYDYLDDCFKINEGFHSYGLDCKISRYSPNTVVVELFPDYPVFYPILETIAVAYCTLPECYVHFVNERKEWVSSAIRIEKIIPYLELENVLGK